MRPYLGYSHIYVNERAGSTSYNSLQVYANKRMSRGLQFQVAYTFSKLISDTINRDSEGRASPMQDAFNPRAERSLANQDQTHALTFNYIYQLPFFRNAKNAFAKGALGGWELVGIATFRSGLPFTPCIDHDVAGTRGRSPGRRPPFTGAIQDHLGHANIQNTMKYVQIANKRRDEFADRLGDWGGR